MPKLDESITLQPKVLRWARERAGLEREQLAANLKLQTQDIAEWEHSGRITFNEVDDLAKYTYTPVGYLYLSEPPDDSLPIADFRTRTGVSPQRPSPNLLDTVYQMQLRQAWMREEMISQEDPSLEFVGASSLDSSLSQVAAAMSDALQLSGGWAAVEGSWTNALRTLRTTGTLDSATSRTGARVGPGGRQGSLPERRERAVAGFRAGRTPPGDYTHP